ncbi:MAG: DUF1679 domain-containing protein [Calditrichaeota bacterium]|nr:MAG: DUF1679 domain-containing protein [Calditrichota bacterium]
MEPELSPAELYGRLSRFLQTEAFSLIPIPGGASSRRYFRLSFEDPLYFPRSEVLLMQVPQSERTVLEDYLNIDYYLRRMGVATPRVYEIKLEEGWLFAEYVEAPTVEAFLQQHPHKTPEVVSAVVEFLKQMQRKCRWEEHCPAFQRRFDPEKYRFEFEFHVREQLLEYHFGRSVEPEVWEPFVETICRKLDVAFPVFVHRDFQSSNLFWRSGNADGALAVIDFQDARYGTPVYDLVSCLWDSYIPIPEAFREEMLREFYPALAEIGVEWDWDTYRVLVDYTVIQRKLHDAGAFAYNHRRFGNHRFLHYILPAIEMALSAMEKYPEFDPVAGCLRELIE